MYSVDDLLKQLALAKGEDLNPVLTKEIRKVLIEIGDTYASKIINEITMLDFLPKNLIGAIRFRYQELKPNIDQYDPKKYYTPPEERATPEEYRKLREELFGPLSKKLDMNRHTSCNDFIKK